MKNVFCVLLVSILFCTVSTLYAQVSLDRGIQSPTAASLGKYGDVPVNFYRGQVQTSIPLYKVKTGDIEVPIVLSNAGSGLKTQEIPGWVGLNWDLQAGGVITRTVRGIPDEHEYGFLSTGHLLEDSNSVSIIGTSISPQYFEKLTADGQLDEPTADSESDVYYYNFNGHTGKFVFSPDGDIEVLNDTPLIFTKTISINNITSWDVITPDGLKYSFDEAEFTSSYSLVDSGVGGTSLNGNNRGYNSSWYLSSIFSPRTGKSVSFTYSDFTGQERDRLDFEERITGNGSQYIRISTFDTHDDIKLLSSITTENEELIFTTSARTDFLDEHKLDAVAIKEGGVLKRSFELNYGYFQLVSSGDGRLRLDSVVPKDYLGNPLSGWNFTYYTGTVPSIDTEAFDLFGYYNGKNFNDGGTILPEIYDPKYNLTFPGDDRSTNANFAMIGMLKKVTYPTGGFTEFEYEGNDYYQTGAGPFYTQKSFDDDLDGSTSALSYESDVFSVGGETSTIDIDVTASGIGLESEGGGGSGGGCSTSTGELLTSQGNYVDDLVSGQTQITVSPGDYKLSLERTNTSCTITVDLDWQEQSSIPVESKKPAGGLRVKKITNHDGISTANDIIKTYEYTLPTDPTISSGYIANEPLYYSAEEFQAYRLYFRSSNNLMSLGSGGLVGYKTVKEVLSGSQSGHNLYHYSIGSDIDSYPFPLGPKSEQGHLRGNLLKLESYNEADILLKKSQHFYDPEIAFKQDSNGANVDAIYWGIKLRKLGNFDIEIDNITFGDIGSYTPSFYYHTRVWTRKSQTIETYYDPFTSDSISYSIEYEHSNTAHKQLVTKKVETNSNNEERVTEYTYAHDEESGMLSDNLLSQPYSVTTKDGTGNVLSKNWTLWDETSSTSNRWQPVEIWQWEGANDSDVTAPAQPNSEAVKVAAYNAYDDYGNPLEVTDGEGNVTRYYFGTNTSSFSQSSTGINGAAGVYLTGIRQDRADGPDLDQSATYNTYGLVSSITGPNGVEATFSYDDFLRLEEVRNDAGQLVEDYVYELGFDGGTYAQANANYIRSHSYDGSSTRESWQYVDGLGRAIQSQHKDGSSRIVSMMEYDEQGREWKTWKPYRMSGTIDYEPLDASYEQNITTYYGDNYPFSEQEYEASPLGRPSKAIMPGGESAFGATTMDYEVASMDGDEYVMTETTDPEGKVIRTYTDGWGRKVFTVADPGGINAKTGFIYDERDQLREVRHPNYYDPPSGSSASDWVTTYDYDKRGNMMEVSSGDFGTRRYAYDKNSQLRFSQDANQSGVDQVAYTSYDEAGRVLRTGIAGGETNFSGLDPTTTEDFEDEQETWRLVNAWDEKPGSPSTTFPWSEFDSGYFDYTPTNAEGQLVAEAYRYGGGNNPTALNLDQLLITTEEQYVAADSIVIGGSIVEDGGDLTLEAGNTIRLTDGFSAESGSSVRITANGNLVGSDMQGVEVAGDIPWMLSLYSYDSEGRVSQQKVYMGDKSDWNATIDYSYNRLGELTTRKVDFGDTIYHHYDYNSLGQLVEVEVSENASPSSGWDIQYSYTPDGQLDEVDYQGGTDMDYAYDIQGRVTVINNIANPGDPFSAAYTYQDNGNIEESAFYNAKQTMGGSEHDRYRYVYSYDGVNRLSGADYDPSSGIGWNTSGNHFKVSGLSYDDQGNITGLQRRDESGTLIDNLSYDYNDSGSWSNRLDGVADAVSTTGSIDWDAEDASFGYDANGNMTSQSGKFTDITYNYQNLPTKFTLDGGGTMVANYNSAGLRIIKEYGGASGTWSYYLRDGNQTLAILDQDGKVNYNIMGNGIEGRYGEVTLSELLNTSGSISSESESNDGQGSADGRIKDGWTMAELDFYTDVDWYYMDVVGDGTITYSIDHQDPSHNVAFTVALYDSQGLLQSDQGGMPVGDSYSVSAGRYWLRVSTPDVFFDPAEYGIYLESSLGSTQQTKSWYYLKDHLGSVRAVVDDGGAHTTSTDYYPFGLAMPGRSSNSANPNDKYKFTGYEHDDEAGINLYHANARFYDPVIPRFGQIDPHHFNYPGVSPYAYVGNNPINIIDPTGMDWYCTSDDDGNCTSYGYDDELTKDNAGDRLEDGQQYLGNDYTVENSEGNDIYLMDGGDWDYIVGQVPEMPEITGLGSTGEGYAWAYALNRGGNAQARAAGRDVVLLRDYLEYERQKREAAGDMVMSIFGARGYAALLRQTGGMKQWLRLGKSYSETSSVATVGFRWGASPRYVRQIKNLTLRKWNRKLRSLKIPGNNWRVNDAGHLHFWKK